MELFSGLFAPENIRGILLLVLIVLFLSGKGPKLIRKILKSRVEGW